MHCVFAPHISQYFGPRGALSSSQFITGIYQRCCQAQCKAPCLKHRYRSRIKYPCSFCRSKPHPGSKLNPSADPPGLATPPPPAGAPDTPITNASAAVKWIRFSARKKYHPGTALQSNGARERHVQTVALAKSPPLSPLCACRSGCATFVSLVPPPLLPSFMTNHKRSRGGVTERALRASPMWARWSRDSVSRDVDVTGAGSAVGGGAGEVQV